MNSRVNHLTTDAGIHLFAGFRGFTLNDELKSFIRDFHIGGIVLFRHNVESLEQLRSLLSEVQAFALDALGRRLLVAIDQEGGPVQRLDPHFTLPCSARELAEEGPQAVMEWAERTATELRSLGVQINFAPVLDVIPDGTDHFMKERSLGANPLRVAQLGEIWLRSLQQNGVSATVKHYPGLGRAESDPHHFAPVIRWKNERAMQWDLLPFRAAIDAGVHCVMTSHALYPFLDPELPATLSARVNREWLREKLGFEGVLFSDDMDMAAVSERYCPEETVTWGLGATLDFFLFCQRPENIEPHCRALFDEIAGNPALAEAHRQSLNRIADLFKRYDPGSARV